MQRTKKGVLTLDLSAENVEVPAAGFAVVLSFTPSQPDEVAVSRQDLLNQEKMMELVSINTGNRRKVAYDAFPMLASVKSRATFCKFWRYNNKAGAWQLHSAASMVPAVEAVMEN
ncbi:hypothetical protein GCM10023186_01580 [Hymenobacter koreensis]|uniref:Uncharacterized protein n=2 Tax=Hymenobacter koreensis TaxID=1084523 RepID=A0ABP8ITK9_9BACT